MCRIFLVFFIVFAPTALALERPGEELEDVRVDPVLGTQIDLSYEMVSSTGQAFNLSDLLGKEAPLIIAPVYYRCPRLCGLLLKGIGELFKKLPFKLGEGYNFLAFSFDSSESPQLAADALTQFVSDNELEGVQGLTFAVADEETVASVMEQLGFGVRPDGEDFAHAAAIYILSPTGIVTHVLGGIEFPPFDARLALVDASQGRTGSLLDHALLFCFRFDPLKGRYTWAAYGLMRVGGGLTLLLLLVLIITLYRRERVRRSV